MAEEGGHIAAEPRRRLATVLAVDVCGYSKAAERDEQAAIGEVAALFSLFQNVVAARRGRVFSRQGDGFFAEFASAADGVDAALEFQARALARRGDQRGALACRAGLHVGDVVEQADGDLLGHGVNVASRLQQDAPEGGVLASAPVAAVAQDAAGALFRRRGAVTLKNIAAPMQVFEIERRADGKASRGLARRLGDALRRRSTTTALIVGAALIVNLVVLAELLRRDERVRALAGAQEAARALETKVETLTVSLGASVGAGADAISLFAARDASKSLLQSEVPEKRRAVSLIESGDLVGAASALEAAYEAQTSAGTPLAARAQTLREIAATVYYADTQRALRALRTLYAIAPQDAVAVYQLGGLYNQLNDPPMARAYFIAAHRMAPKPSRLAVLAEVGVGRAALQTGDFAAAEKALRAALADAQEEGYTEEETLTELKLGVLAFLRRDFDASARHRERALVLARATGDRHAAVEALNTLGTISLELKDYPAAAERLEAALAEVRGLDDARAESSVLVNLAQCRFAQGNIAASRDHAQAALAIARRDKLPVLTAIALEQLARIAQAEGDKDGQCRLVDEARDARRLARLPESAPPQPCADG